MLGVVGCVLAVVCKRMQPLPTILGPAVQRGKDTSHKGQVIRATFSHNLSRNIVALQVEKRCCPYYHPRTRLVTQLNKFRCCKLWQCVAQSRSEFQFLQQTFNFIIYITTCYTSQHLWLVNFPATKTRERWWVSARLTSGISDLGRK